MAWLESHQQLERHPKTHSLMSIMGWSLDETIGKLHRFWWWCLDFAPTGDLRKFNDNVIGGSVGLSADMSVKFVRAMVEACWLDRGNGVFRIHDWPHYAGRFLRDTRFKRQPERWKEVQSLYEIPVSRQSADNPPNQPTNQPTVSPPPARAAEVPDELLTEGQAMTQAHTAGVPEDFARYVFPDWESRGGKDGAGVKTPWAGYVKKRWNREQQEWTAGTHRGKQKGRNEKDTRSEIDRDRHRTGIKTTAGDGLRSL